MMSMWVVGVHTGAGAVSHTTAGLDDRLITTTSCRKHGTFHHHLSLLDHVLTQPAGPGNMKLLNRPGPVFCAGLCQHVLTVAVCAVMVKASVRLMLDIGAL